MSDFQNESEQRIGEMQLNVELQEHARSLFQNSIDAKYSYNFYWLGRPIIQYPQDICALQEIIWNTKPDLIIETGIAHGGSLILSASMLAVLDYCDAVVSGQALIPKATKRRVLGVDIDIRAPNRAAIEAHPLAHMITMLEGSSVEPGIVSRVQQAAAGHDKVLVILDSNHTHDHVLAELEAYAPLISPGSYCIVFDTVVEDLPNTMFHDRPWSIGNNPKTAVAAYLEQTDLGARKASDGLELRFEVDTLMEHKLLLTVAPGGYLRRL